MGLGLEMIGEAIPEERIRSEARGWVCAIHTHTKAKPNAKTNVGAPISSNPTGSTEQAGNRGVGGARKEHMDESGIRKSQSFLQPRYALSNAILMRLVASRVLSLNSICH